MNQDTLNQIEFESAREIGKILEDFDCKVNVRLASVVEQEVARSIELAMANGQVFELTDDEERLLLAYRAFVGRSPGGSIFQWRIPAPVGIAVPTKQTILTDPRLVSV